MLNLIILTVIREYSSEGELISRTVFISDLLSKVN